MAKHEFGIMQTAPERGRRYDDYVEIIDAKLSHADFYWHTLEMPAKGLAYTGVTLIPPSSIKTFIEVIKDISELSELKELSKKALASNKWIIHFGL